MVTQKPAEKLEEELIDFGFQTVPKAAKEHHVRAVFDSVAGNYDIMNDVMSLGLHRWWKQFVMTKLAPMADKNYLDLACGTGDLSAEILRLTQNRAFVTSSDINESMIKAGQARSAQKTAEINAVTKGAPPANQQWVVANAESLPFDNNTYDGCVLAFGFRNMTDRLAVLKEVRRCLKPMGHFLCLEFCGQPDFSIRRFYDFYSFQILPFLGEKIAKDRDSYQYLAESIRRFPPLSEITDMMSAAGFRQITATPMTSGIVTLFSGWK